MDEMALLVQLRDELASDDVEPPQAMRDRVLGEAIPHVQPGTRRSARFATLAALAVAATCIAVLAPTLMPGGSRQPSQSAVAAVFERAARTAEAQPALQVPPGSYIYRELVHVYVYIDGDLEKNPRQTYDPHHLVHDQDRWWIAAYGVKPTVHQNRVDSGPWREDVLPAGPRNINPGGYRPDLPTDPDAMLHWIYTHLDGGNPRDIQAFTTVGDLLLQAYLPPASLSALYRAAAQIPGTSVREDEHDALGRPAVAVVMGNAALLFDVAHYQYLGRRYVATAHESAPAGTVLSNEAITKFAVTSRPREMP